jgi:DNA-binding NarL/FixJ family response regulator
MKNIFIVDDSTAIRERLHSVIAEISGARVVGEADGREEALNMILTSRVDIVVIDIQLMKGSGIEVLRQLKKMQPAIKVMVLTNHAYSQFRQECMKQGADGFLDKSKDFALLDGVLRDWISAECL